MTNLVVATIADLKLPPGVQLSAQGLALPPGLTFEDYEDVGRHLMWLQSRIEEAHDTILWMIADWLQYGEFTYGEKFAQAANIFGRSEKRLQNLQWVGRAFPETRRRASLSFEHHAEVAGCELDEQNRLLDLAEKEELNTGDLRRLRRKDADGEYAVQEAKSALDRAASTLSAISSQHWATLIMGYVVRPLKHEVDQNTYRKFVGELFTEVSGWRDVT